MKKRFIPYILTLLSAPALAIVPIINNYSIENKTSTSTYATEIRVDNVSDIIASTVTTSTLDQKVDGWAVANRLDFNLANSNSKNEVIENINSLRFTSVENTNMDNTYAGKVIASGNVSARIKTSGYDGVKFSDRDRSFDNWIFTGFKVWNTNQTVTEKQAPSELTQYPLEKAGTYANEYVIDNFDQYVEDLPVDWRNYIQSNGFEIDRPNGSLTVKTRLTKIIDNGSVSNTPRDYSITFTGFTKFESTYIEDVTLENFGNGKFYLPEDNIEIQNKTLEELKKDSSSYIPDDAVVSITSKIDNEDSEAKGIFKFNAELSPFFSEGQLDNGPKPLTITVTGYNRYNTTVVSSPTDEYDGNNSELTVNQVQTSDIANTIVQLIQEKKIFEGQLRNTTFDEFNGDKINLQIENRNTTDNKIVVNIYLKALYVWQNGEPGTNDLEAKVTLTGFKPVDAPVDPAPPEPAPPEPAPPEPSPPDNNENNGPGNNEGNNGDSGSNPENNEGNNDGSGNESGNNSESGNGTEGNQNNSSSNEKEPIGINTWWIWLIVGIVILIIILIIITIILLSKKKKNKKRVNRENGPKVIIAPPRLARSSVETRTEPYWEPEQVSDAAIETPTTIVETPTTVIETPIAENKAIKTVVKPAPQKTVVVVKKLVLKK